MRSPELSILCPLRIILHNLPAAAIDTREPATISSGKLVGVGKWHS